MSRVNYAALYHHGILGQKWGVRNGPPYPLGASDKTASERNAEKEKFHLSDRQKTALKIGAAAVATALVAYGGYKLYESGALDNFVDVGKNKVTDILGIDVDNYDSSFKLTSSNLQQCAANVNPSKSETNCGSCASATIQNMMGGNFQALEEVPEHMRIAGRQGYDPEKLIECYEGASWEPSISGMNRKQLSDKVEQKILSFGDGAKGIMYPEKIRKRATSHYFSWIVQDGKVKVVESQPRKEGIVWDKSFYEDVGQLFDPMYEVRVTRLDNHPVIPERKKDLFKPRE